MRQASRLIEEARLSTNIDSSDVVSDRLCIMYLNRIQSHIQDVIFSTNTESRFFKGTAKFNLISGYDTYQLPYDIYNKNSINTVQIRYSNGTNYSYASLKKISERRRGQETGYFVYDDKIVFTPIPLTTDTIVISYQKKIPSLGLVNGKITGLTSTQLTVTAYGTDKTSVFDDHFSTVDSNGKILTYGNKIITDTLTSIDVSDTTGMLSNQLIVPGFNATNISSLPDECEPLMIEMLESCMHGRLSSKDIQISEMFTGRTLEKLIDIFKENSGDVFSPPVQEFSEWI